VNILPLRVYAALSLGSLANAIATELNDFANRENIDRIDMLMHKSMRVQSLEGGSHAGRKLPCLGDAKSLPTDHLGQACIDGLKNGIDDRRVVEYELTELLDLENVGVAEGLYASPASQDFLFIKVRRDQSNDRRNSLAV
jgi:hypothetical protein